VAPGEPLSDLTKPYPRAWLEEKQRERFGSKHTALPYKASWSSQSHFIYRIYSIVSRPWL